MTSEPINGHAGPTQQHEPDPNPLTPEAFARAIRDLLETAPAAAATLRLAGTQIAMPAIFPLLAQFVAMRQQAEFQHSLIEVLAAIAARIDLGRGLATQLSVARGADPDVLDAARQEAEREADRARARVQELEAAVIYAHGALAAAREDVRLHGALSAPTRPAAEEALAALATVLPA